MERTLYRVKKSRNILSKGVECNTIITELIVQLM